jgi:hypothetical protein
MTDITDLFSHVASAVEQPPSDAVVDADIARGHRALTQAHQRRLMRRSLITAVTLATAAGGIVAVTQLRGSGSAQHHSVAGGATVTNPSSSPVNRSTVQQAPAIRLVAYTGSQLAGFTVDRVPDGWQLSTSTRLALTINAADDTNHDPDVFEGKLTVLLQSQDAHGLPPGTSVTVDGQPGVVTDQGRYGEILTYSDGKNHTVVIQAPKQLGWATSQIVSFAEGVHVTGDALAGRG